MLTPTCPDCGFDQTDLIGDCGAVVEATAAEYADWRSTALRLLKTQLFRCYSCDIVFRFPAPNAEELRELYARIPTGRWDYKPSEIGGWFEALRILRASNLNDTRVLDVGSYDGQFLALLPDHLTKAAIEPAESVVGELKKKGIEWIGVNAGSTDPKYHNYFDVITMFDVFEHLPSPRHELLAICRLLAPGGRLFIATGNAQHWTWNRLRGNHWYLHTLQHLCFGSVSYFRKLAAVLDVELSDIVLHPHHRCKLSARIIQAFESWHFVARNSVGFQRKMAGMIQRLPRAGYLIHRRTGPYAPALFDHLLVTYTKPKTSCNIAASDE
jgi:SAM-dependent methyltransferase